jgi:hypothetical protein
VVVKIDLLSLTMAEITRISHGWKLYHSTDERLFFGFDGVLGKVSFEDHVTLDTI